MKIFKSLAILSLCNGYLAAEVDDGANPFKADWQITAGASSSSASASGGCCGNGGGNVVTALTPAFYFTTTTLESFPDSVILNPGDLVPWADNFVITSGDADFTHSGTNPGVIFIKRPGVYEVDFVFSLSDTSLAPHFRAQINAATIGSDFYPGLTLSDGIAGGFFVLQNIINVTAANVAVNPEGAAFSVLLRDATTHAGNGGTAGAPRRYAQLCIIKLSNTPVADPLLPEPL